MLRSLQYLHRCGPGYNIPDATYPMHSWLWAAVIFLSHYPIDRWALADRWLKLIHARSLEDFIANGKQGIPPGLDPENYHVLRGSFTGLVYAAADNTMHLVIMYHGAKLLGLTP